MLITGGKKDKEYQRHENPEENTREQEIEEGVRLESETEAVIENIRFYDLWNQLQDIRNQGDQTSDREMMHEEQ